MHNLSSESKEGQGLSVIKDEWLIRWGQILFKSYFLMQSKQPSKIVESSTDFDGYSPTSIHHSLLI